MATLDHLHGQQMRFRKNEERDYRLVYAGSFIFFLLIALALRWVPSAWMPLPRSGNRRTTLGDAKALANVTIPYAFMR